MIIHSLELKDFRNYEQLRIDLDDGINIFHGDNAQGKTNILESVYVGCTSKSHKASKDRELIRFGCEESHIKLRLEKKEVPHRIDMHIKKNQSKGIALDGIPIRRASELFGIANLVMFSPEDLGIIKNSPSERRRFLDLELCQLNRIYTHFLISYNRLINQKNKLLKEIGAMQGLQEMLSVYNEQLIEYGSELIRARALFVKELNRTMQEVHSKITDGKETIEVRYEANTSEEQFAAQLKKYGEQELRQRMCLVGPHRDDLAFRINDVDIRRYGSQGQQRTAALSLKLSEIRLVEEMTKDRPVLLLDDVLSELDRSRQTMLLSAVGGIQTIITCTGLDDFVGHRFRIDRTFYVKDGTVTGETK